MASLHFVPFEKEMIEFIVVYSAAVQPVKKSEEEADVASRRCAAPAPLLGSSHAHSGGGNTLTAPAKLQSTLVQRFTTGTKINANFSLLLLFSKMVCNNRVFLLFLKNKLSFLEKPQS